MKKILTCLFSLLLVIGIVGFNQSDVLAEGYAQGYTDWDENETGYDGEKTKTLYRYREFLGYITTSEPTDPVLSRKAEIVSTENEFIVMNNGKFRPVGDAYTGDGVRKTYSGQNGAGITFKINQTIDSNKWKYKYADYTYEDGGSRDTTTELGHSTSTNYTCYSYSCSGRPHGSAWTNTVYMDKSWVTYDPHKDDPSYEIFEYSILGMGSEATFSARYGPGGYRTGIDEHGQLNSYGEECTSELMSLGQCSSYRSEIAPSCPSGKGRGTSSNTYDWCYETRYGNKTFVPGEASFRDVQLTNGKTLSLGGVNGNVTLYEENRKNIGFPDDGGNGWSSVQVYGLSLVERIYYYHYSDTYEPGEPTTYVTPMWTEWSGWIEGTPPSGNENLNVETKTLYSHPIKAEITPYILTYNGEYQILFDVKYTGGIIYFGIGTSDTVGPTEWSREICRGKEVGIYPIWYKVVNPNNPNELYIKPTYAGDAQIIKAKIKGIECESQIYTGEELIGCTCEKGTLKGDWKATDPGTYVASCEIDLGSYETEVQVETWDIIDPNASENSVYSRFINKDNEDTLKATSIWSTNEEYEEYLKEVLETNDYRYKIYISKED